MEPSKNDEKIIAETAAAVGNNEGGQDKQKLPAENANFNAVEEAEMLRVRLKRFGPEFLGFAKIMKNLKTLPDTADRGEMIANIMLGYRHLEDCIMRCGKVIQAYQGGVSVYDKPKN